jgi:uncharacterized protein with HEPN domain
MRPEERDPAHLWDLQEAAREVAGFVAGADFERFRTDKLLRYAVERQTSQVGRAAERVSAAFKAAHPEAPWSALQDQPDLLTPERDREELDRVWYVASEQLPRLLPTLEALVPPLPDYDEP